MAILEQIEDMFRYPKKMLIEPGAAAARLASPAMQLAIGMGTRPTLNPAVLAGTPPTPVVTSPNNPAAPIGLIPAELAALFSGPGGGLLDDSIRNTALFGLAQGLLAQSGWQAAPVGFGQALGAGLLGMREAEQAALLGMLQRAQMEAAEAETADRERLQAYAESTGDPLAALAPGKYVEQMLENRFPTPDRELEEVYDPKSPTGTRLVPRSEAAGQPGKPSAQATPDRELEEVYDPTSPTGTRLLPRSKAAGQPGKPSSRGVNVYGPDGELIVEIGGSGGPTTEGGRAKIEAKELNAQETLAQLANVEATFRPEYLEYGTRWTNFFRMAKEKAGVGLSPEERQAVTEFSAFRRNAANNLNRTLNQLSGAAVTIPEYERLTRELPNVGTGFFDGDSPTEFKAKMDASILDMKRALIRLRYAKALGMNPLQTGIDLADVDNLVRRRAEEVRAVLKRRDPQADDAMIEGMTRDYLQRELGVD